MSLRRRSGETGAAMSPDTPRGKEGQGKGREGGDKELRHHLNHRKRARGRRDGHAREAGVFGGEKLRKCPLCRDAVKGNTITCAALLSNDRLDDCDRVPFLQNASGAFPGSISSLIGRGPPPLEGPSIVIASGVHDARSEGTSALDPGVTSKGDYLVALSPRASGRRPSL